MDNLRPALLSFNHIRESDRMGLGHVTAHNQNSIAVHKVLWKCRGAATSQRCTQTGYGGTVSYTGLVLNRNDPQSAAEELFHQIILFNVQRCSAESGYAGSEEHTSELQSPDHLVCRLLLEKKKKPRNP